MKTIKLVRRVVLGGVLLAIAACAGAATVQTEGAGSAVSIVDRATTFDDLDYTHNGTTLSDYSSNGLYVRVDGDSFAGNGPASWPYLNPFHINSPGSPPGAYYYPGGGFSCPNLGSYGWVTIETTDATTIYGVEFLYGNGWTTGDIDGSLTGYPWGNAGAYVEWQTLRAGTVVSSGQIGPDPVLNLGVVLGFFDPDGFDQLLVRCRHPNSYDPALQVLAMDDLNVQLTVPEPATLALLAALSGVSPSTTTRA